MKTVTTLHSLRTGTQIDVVSSDNPAVAGMTALERTLPSGLRALSTTKKSHAKTVAYLKEKGYKEGKAPKPPSLAMLKKWCDDGSAETLCGCTVEPDGVCPHGNPSWLIILGLI